MQGNIESILEIFLWVIGGILVGIIGLGVFNFYLVLNTSPTPGIDFKIPQTLDSKSEPRTFKPVDKFSLFEAQSYATSQDDTEKKDRKDNSNEKRSESKSATKIEKTNLPIELQGTMTGVNQLGRAYVKNKRTRETRTMKKNEEWNQFVIKKIRSNEVIIFNKEKNRLELLPLKNQ